MNIWIIGDSTAAIKDSHKRPETGWGEKISLFLKSGIKIQNHATNGRSTKSFIDENRFSDIESKFEQGDYLFIQFGHNDQKIEDPTRFTDPFSTYQENLSFFIRKAKEKGVIPVVFSSVPRRKFLSEHRLDRLAVGKYPNAAKLLAKREGVLFLDIFTAAKRFYEYLGFEDAARLFLQLHPNQHPNYPEGKIDNTHFNETGAYVIASIIAAKMYKAKHVLRTLVDETQLIDRKAAKDYVYGHKK